MEVDGKYTMRIRNEYLPRVKQFAQEMEISRAALRTLAYVAKHDGVLKSEAVKHIGTQVYDDVKELVQSGFLRTQKSGRSAKLSVTEKFRKYFIQAKAAVKEEPIKQTTLPETAVPAAPASAPEPQQYDEEIMEK
jgi:chromosome segregation and condensation protein ScpB